MQLEARDQQTYMDYSGQAQVGGRIASVGQRLMDSAARSIIRQSLEALNEYLKIEVAKQAPSAACCRLQRVERQSKPRQRPPRCRLCAAACTAGARAYKPPSQMTLALTSRRDVLNDIIPAQISALGLAAR